MQLPAKARAKLLPVNMPDLPSSNHRIVLQKRPVGSMTTSCFSLDEQPLAQLDPGQVRVVVDHLSVDAFIRTSLRGEGFHQQVPIGGTIGALGVGYIAESTDPDWPVGQAVSGGVGAQTVATLAPKQLQKVDGSFAPLSAHLGVLGLTTGLTAWVGMRHVGQPQPGETVVVSAAAGAVGSIAGQVARLDGAHVIGIAGGPQKAAFLVDELGFDAAIDYKSEDVRSRLGELAPDGVNVFFDNVGGDILDAVLDNLALRSRVVICGAISQYDQVDGVTGPSSYLKLAERQSRMEGFAVFHFPESYATATAELAEWLGDGSLKAPEHVFEGIDQFPQALIALFNGENLGKTLVKVSHS